MNVACRLSAQCAMTSDILVKISTWNKKENQFSQQDENREELMCFWTLFLCDTTLTSCVSLWLCCIVVTVNHEGALCLSFIPFILISTAPGWGQRWEVRKGGVGRKREKFLTEGILNVYGTLLVWGNFFTPAFLSGGWAEEDKLSRSCLWCPASDNLCACKCVGVCVWLSPDCVCVCVCVRERGHQFCSLVDGWSTGRQVSTTPASLTPHPHTPRSIITCVCAFGVCKCVCGCVRLWGCEYACGCDHPVFKVKNRKQTMVICLAYVLVWQSAFACLCVFTSELFSERLPFPHAKTEPR